MKISWLKVEGEVEVEGQIIHTPQEDQQICMW